MLRINPTGNGTFDAVEVAAYQTYLASFMARGLEDTGPLFAVQSEVQFEIGYFYTCWKSAITQLAGDDGYLAGATSIGGKTFVGHNIAVPLDRLAINLAKNLVNRGFTGLPTSFQVAKSGVIGAGGASYAVGDIVKITNTSAAAWVGATFKVATVSVGAVVTLTTLNMGLYTATPANPAATTHSTGSGDDNLTITVTYATLPVLFN